MKKLKNLLIYVVSLALVVCAAVAGTVAYLTYEDSDVNVMTLGNVEIEQIEQQRGENGLEDFEDNKPLYPAVFEGSSIPWASEDKWVVAGDQAWKVVEDNENVVDKFVTVKNTGKSEAYVRTLIAFEGDETYGPKGEYIHIVMNADNVNPAIDVKFKTVIDIEGVKYSVYSFTYPEALGVGQTSVPSLKQVYMNKAATNDVVATYGETYDILVLSQAVQTNGFANAQTALDTSFGVVNKANAEEWFAGVSAKNSADTWDGTADTSWYLANETEFEIETAEELAGLISLVDDGVDFEDKTITLEGNLDLYKEDDNGNPICFDPIGSYRNEQAFRGTFDGNGYTISNMNQRTWNLDIGYYYSDLGLGLFSCVENAEIKNLNIDNANLEGESAICGIVAATAYGDCTFENITVTNSVAADYQYYAGGIVGWASGNHKYINCNVDASTTIAAQWGDFDNSTGGIIGGAGGSAQIYLKDCEVACRIDAYNDVTSSNQWYAYRRCGMLIGNTGKTTTNASGSTVAIAPQLTCENVTVIYGDWADYHYCEFAGTSWPYVRCEAGFSNSGYSNPRYGHPTDANGNIVENDNHVHNDGEDHKILLAFDQLYGGGQGVYGTATHEGVTVVYNNK